LDRRAKGFTVWAKNSASAPISSPITLRILLRGYGVWFADPLREFGRAWSVLKRPSAITNKNTDG
jgi:hypothetical protein